MPKFLDRVLDLASAGDVDGPASSINNDIALFDGITGKIIKDSGVQISTDGTLAANSDALVSTQKAVKTYVDNAIAGSGDVVGPASSTDNALVRFDGLTGKLIKDSVALLNDLGALSGLTAVSVTGPTTMNGAQVIKRRATAIDGTILLTDYYVGVTSTGAARAYTLDAAGQVYVSNQTWIVKDEGGDAAANNITITPNSGLIDGAANTVIDGPYDSVTILYDGVNYFTI